MNRQRIVAVACAATVGMVTLASRLWAVCPSCKEGLAGAERWAQGFNTSIMFMMVMPFAVVGVIAGAIYHASRQRGPSAGGDDVPTDSG